MNIKLKLNVIFFSLLGLILLSSIVNFYSKSRFSDVLDFITGPAWDSADGAMEGSIEIERQMLLVAKIVSQGTSEHARKALGEELNDAIKNADEALARMRRAGLVDVGKIKRLEETIKEFVETRQQLLQNSQIFFEKEHRLDEGFRQYQGFFVGLEELGDSAVEALENQPNKPISWNGGLRERWELADGAMEANIAMLSRIYFYERIVFEGFSERLELELGSALRLLEALVVRLQGLEQLKTNRPDNDNRSYAQLLRTYQDNHTAQFDEALIALRAFNNSKASYDSLANRLLQQVAEIEELGDSQVEGQSEAIAALHNLVNILAFAATAAGVIVAFVARQIAIKDIAAPLRRIGHTLSSSRNNLTVRLEEDYAGEIGQLSKEVNGFNDATKNTLRSISNEIEQLNLATGSLNEIAGNNASVTDFQKKEVDIAVSSLSQLSAAAEQISSSMEHTNSMVTDLKNRIYEGSNAIGQSVQVSEKTSTQLSSANDSIQRLQEQTQTIGSVLEVINGIAEQTNLLALNAAIEAARAGEQGRGFAVVADEVRNLAHKTQESTLSIQSTIEQLQHIANEAVLLIQDCVNNAATNKEMVAQSGTVFEETQEAINTLVNMSSEVVAAAQEQSVVLQEVNNNMEKINSRSEQSEALAEQTEGLSVQLTEITQRQQQNISKFIF